VSDGFCLNSTLKKSETRDDGERQDK